MPVATATTEPTTKAMDGTMQVTTAAMKTTGETTGIFNISKIISIKIKELRTNSHTIPNNISCNELPNYSTPKSNGFAVESNSLNWDHKNAYLLCLGVRIQKSMFQMFLNIMYSITCKLIVPFLIVTHLEVKKRKIQIMRN